MTLQDLVARYKPGNPFAGKAAIARLSYTKAVSPTAHDLAMANSFPLGGGYAHSSSAKRISQSVDSAVKAERHRKEAEWMEARAAAYDAGKINAQGRRPAKNADAARKRRELLKMRAAVAGEARRGKEIWQVRGCTVADSASVFGGAALKFVLTEHQGKVAQALSRGDVVPPEVLADYPELRESEE